MTNGWRLYVGTRNCSASLRRVSSLGLMLGARFGFGVAERTILVLVVARITPPRAPLASPEGTPERHVCREWHLRNSGRGSGFARHAKENPANRRQRCAPRERRLREPAWRLQVLAPCRRKQPGTGRGVRFPPMLLRRGPFRRRERQQRQLDR